MKEFISFACYQSKIQNMMLDSTAVPTSVYKLSTRAHASNHLQNFSRPIVCVDLPHTDLFFHQEKWSHDPFCFLLCGGMWSESWPTASNEMSVDGMCDLTMQQHNCKLVPPSKAGSSRAMIATQNDMTLTHDMGKAFNGMNCPSLCQFETIL